MKTFIKICGITTIEEVLFLNTTSVDYVGFVLFYPKSKRNISLDTVSTLLHHLSSSIKSVAVVVSPSFSQLIALEQLGFDYVQIHGEIPEIPNTNFQLPILKAFNVKDLSTITLYHTHPLLFGFVVDSSTPGSGTTFDWSILKTINFNNKPFFLAGGLTVFNVSDAIDQVIPYGVDVSSGVEASNGTGKDLSLIHSFISNVRKE
ncbi:MAG: phosphoribosylanthranilate isomerase [Lachnospiraceae bacterium]